MKTFIIIAAGLLIASSGFATKYPSLNACKTAAANLKSGISCSCSATKITEGLGEYCVEWTGAIAAPGQRPPWETNRWPWVGALSNALPGAQIALLDSRGTVLSETQVNRDGSYSLPAPRVAVQEAPRVCILRQGTPPLCGKPGDDHPTLTSPGISIRVLPKAANTNPSER